MHDGVNYPLLVWHLLQILIAKPKLQFFDVIIATRYSYPVVSPLGRVIRIKPGVMLFVISGGDEEELGRLSRLRRIVLHLADKTRVFLLHDSITPSTTISSQ
jgi:hypothetical protein